MPESYTSQEKIDAYRHGKDVFGNLIFEMRELSKKKPDATLSGFKVDQINRVLKDMLAVLTDEPEARYLDTLSHELLPQNSDAVLVMCQFQGALAAFEKRYHRCLADRYKKEWVTEDVWREYQAELEEEDEEDGDEDDDL